MLFLLIGITGLYVALALGAAWMVRRAHVAPVLPEERLPRISVVVAARDEEAVLPRCLTSLQHQDYPPDRIEFVLVDDGSTDTTSDLMARRAQRDPRFKALQTPRGGPTGAPQGKAAALHHAIEAASGELLLVTDADCAPPLQWARRLASQFQDPGVGMICGVTGVSAVTTLDRIQALDWLLLLTVAAAASEAGLPLTAMGNNMAFRREAYRDVGGYPALPFSVTEDYALYRAVHRSPAWRVRLLLDAGLYNRTEPLSTMRAVFQQRKRWARGGLQAPPWAYLLYTAVFFVHLLLLAGFFAAPLLAGVLLLTKTLADLLVLRTGGDRLEVPIGDLLRSLPLFELYLFGYVLLMPFALLLSPRITWKDRTF